MFLELIAAVFAAVAAAGVVYLLNRLLGGRLPGWLMPVAAGAMMILFTIRMEYTWFERTSAEFPEDVVVTKVHESTAFFRPWTYVTPLVNRFAAVETSAIRSNEAVPHLRMFDMLLFGRWQPPQVVPMIVDCDAQLGAPLLDTVTFDASGAVENAQWAPIPEDDLTLATVCKEIRP
ncbi:hypothetical protein [Aliiruegeria lutimaris]|uniref:Uncharacterized protein n=1 Tax=Aliiruegeria lutimaris TaxID=571298 RepID=A0A1G8QML6_9RHOB|nr:hypothetical protein [Aliiruegeria lutimaris]SDJ05841.1 hypothetical protein SAMN04488026_101143 [Aliiruegeria lutimaris]